MTPEKGRSIIARYRALLNYMPEAEGPLDREPTPREALSHVQGMMDKMERLLDQAEGPAANYPSNSPWDKFNRWLGFVQGVLWLHGDFTLDQLKKHNRTVVQLTDAERAAELLDKLARIAKGEES